MNDTNTTTTVIIDSNELARRWKLPATWIREQTRSRALDPIPHLRMGRYVRFEYGSPDLAKWLERRRSKP
ncbi:MAG: hypothetical protein DMG98_23305 [Acidobacteria bacterium]|nr:MAG: hypothetical protein DMG98_23305 [Acidobacteriota bacterium]